MKFYIVGTPESLHTTNFLGTATTREFTEKDFLHNLNALSEIKLFCSFEGACNYARSLRIQNPTKMLTPDKRKIAPVMEMNFTGDQSKLDNQQTITVNFKEYINIYANFSNQDNPGNDIEKSAEVTFIAKNKADIDLSEFKLVSAAFPDINYPVQYFNIPRKECALF